MRIAYVSTIRSAPWGGSEELWLQSATAVMAAGHVVGVFVYEWPEEPTQLQRLREKGAAIFKRKRSASLPVRVLHKLAGKMGAGNNLYFNPYKELLSYNPDRVVVTDGDTWYAANDHWLSDLLERHFSGRYLVISQSNGPHHFPASRDSATRFFTKAKRIIFVAGNNREQAFHQLARRLDNTMVIQNPVNLTAFEPIALPPIKDGYVDLAMVGRLSVSDKGQDIIIAMMSEEHWRKRKVRIHLYGRGGDLEYLKKLIAYYKVEQQVFIEGHATVGEIWAKCHGLLMPSILEGTPLTLLEAMVLGRVCIVTRVGGNDEWIVDSRNGFLVEAPTRQLLSDRLRTALDDLEKWPDIARTAHLDAMAKLDKNPGYTLLEQIISE